MMMYQTQPRAAYGKKAKRWTAFAFFLCTALHLYAITNNVVTGLAYGTNYTALATAGTISSVASADGTLAIGYAGTTNLTLRHDITGFVTITNQTNPLTVDATGASLAGTEGTVAALMVFDTANLSVTNGRFIGAPGVSDNVPPTPLPDSAGGWISGSTATISGSEFTGTNGTFGLIVGSSSINASNITVRGGAFGSGILAFDNSSITIHSGSSTGGLAATAIWSQNSDITIYDGSFAGNVSGTETIIGDGLFSELTEAATNRVNLHGGTFSSLAFYSTNGAVQHFLAGTNLVVQNGIVQSGGTVLVDNQSEDALQQIRIFDGSMMFSNDYTLANGGMFSLESATSDVMFNSLILDSGAVFNMGAGKLTATSNLTASAGSEILLIATNTANILADTATFGSNSTIMVSAGAFAAPTNDLNIVETSTGIFVDAGGITNATTANFNSNVNVIVDTDWLTTYNGAFIDSGRNLRLQFFTQSWSEGWGLDGQMAVFADELEMLDNGSMNAIISALGPEASLAATETTYFTTMNTFQTVLQGLQSAVGQSVSRGAEFREQIQLRPSGARGPQPHQSALRGWAKYYGNRYSHDADGLNQEYDTRLDGAVLGIDKSISSLLVGLAGGYGDYSTTAGGDGEENITAYHGSLYGTYGFDKAYIDAGVAYGFNEVETRTSSPFILNGEFDAQIISGYLGGGIDLVDSTEGMVFTPEASIQYSLYEQDAYTETSTVAVPRKIDAFDADSLRASLGLNVSVQEAMKFETISLKYDVRFHWIREFNPEPGNMNFSLDGGNEGYQLTHPMLDEDIYRAGVGAVFFNTKRNQPKNIMFRIDFDELFGDGFNSHNLSAKVVYAF